MRKIEKVLDALAYGSTEPIVCDRCKQKSLRFSIVPRRGSAKMFDNAIVCENCYREIMEYLKEQCLKGENNE